ncbi:MAG: YkgJ family cysteine cluster protein [Gammaproteobacteria bacterium]|nr:YkgJ family cysteine cluster protein [Gammaproteobacteria bacterium]MBU2057484.1 YkgJ family cysteine cluster protein [Gammaproteobacteria bacterium]MBU2176244.1 YkgJ family cysteine cluster protein [Gammaproteobacteria bacterium]MBU2245845.1 YkgJ family cysteine cluster protein [Gammaproteobacteria bacterium]MBU2343119.1 YkgJ family cysteine cluster protein [Gammaproteobacteria bacterium]
MQQLLAVTSELMILNDEIAKTYSGYQNDRKLFCRTGCGECCLHPGIEASVLEMLPLALHLHEQGTAESTLAAIQQYEQESCFFYQPSSADRKSGHCSIYAYRPAVCRMFGAAGYRGRQGEVLLSICKVIRADEPAAVVAAELSLTIEVPPMMMNHKAQIAQLDYELSKQNMPIKDAAAAALEKVLTKAWYADMSGFSEPL